MAAEKEREAAVEPTAEKNKVWYGSIEVEPKGPIEAGSYGSYTLTYTVGRYGMDNGGRLRLLFRYAWDGGRPQTTDPAGDNYVAAATSNPAASVKIDFLPKGGRRPWLPCLVLEIKDDSLSEGDRVYIRFGDTSGGSRGHRAQTFVESDFRWLSDVECFETGTWVELDDCPISPIVASRPERLAAIAPSVRTSGEPFSLIVKATDAYGNPAPTYAGDIRIAAERWQDGGFERCGDEEWSGSSRIRCDSRESETLAGTFRLDGFVLKRPGAYRFMIEDERNASLNAASNVVTVEETEETVHRHHWGDLHGQYNNALGTGSVAEAFRYARDAGGAEFVGHQPNDFQFRQEGWEEVKQAVRQFHEPGRFVPFLGYEWSGNTPAGGDRNVHFLGDDGPLHRSSHWHVPDKSDAHMDRYPLDRLYAEFAGRDDVLIVPHVGGRRCNITKYHEAGLEPVLEICSCHGRFEWLLHEALESGLTVGVIGGSDDHTGRPGAAYATSHSFGTRGGLAGIYAKELSRAGVFEALRARHTYATTGERIWLHVGTTDGRMMGDVITARTPPAIRIRAAGTGSIERIDVLRNHDVAFSYVPYAPTSYRPDRIRLEWGGARVTGRGRHSTWNGKVTVDGADILAAKAFAFDHPLQGIVSSDRRNVAWTSTTSGDHDGIVLTLSDTAEQAVIRFETELLTESFAVADLLSAPIRRECGGVGQYAQFALQPTETGPQVVDFMWQDPEPAPGRNAYWIRLVQEDGEMAWSSPIYVTYGEEAAGG